MKYINSAEWWLTVIITITLTRIFGSNVINGAKNVLGRISNNIKMANRDRKQKYEEKVEIIAKDKDKTIEIGIAEINQRIKALTVWATSLGIWIVSRSPEVGAREKIIVSLFVLLASLVGGASFKKAQYYEKLRNDVKKKETHLEAKAEERNIGKQ